MSYDRPALRRAATRFLVNAGVLLATGTLCIVAAELVARRFLRVERFRYVSSDGRPWNVDHPTRRYTLTPGYRGRLLSSEYDVEVSINALGFRGPEPVLRYPRVFVVGDSFVFGVGVRVEDALPARLEAHLRSASLDREVWNLGVPSYNPQQYADIIEEYRRFEPTDVVLCFTAGKLFSGADDIYGAAVFEKEEGGIHRAGAEAGKAARSGRTASPARPRSIKKWLSRHSALYNALLLELGPRIRSAVQGRRKVSEEEGRLWARGWKIVDATLERLRRTALERDFSLTVTYMPSEADVANDYREISVRLGAICQRLNVPFIDGREVLRGASLKNAYFPIDGHMTLRGNDALAGAIAASLQHTIAARREVRSVEASGQGRH